MLFLPPEETLHMNSLLDWLTNYCINNQLISKDREEWFRYGLEKRLCTLYVLVPFSLIAVRISGYWIAFSYLTSFFYLRSQTNGYHSKTHLGCLIGSLFLELFFLICIEPMMDTTWVLVLVSITVIVVFTLAPYNHPRMDLNLQESSACKKASRIRCLHLALSCFIFKLCGLHEIANGISLGCAMTSTLLIFANITERRSPYDSVEDRGEQCTSFVIQQDD